MEYASLADNNITNTMIWKLLRQHISIAQFAGFALANLFGMLILMLGYQMYRDVEPVFTSGDSFLHTTRTGSIKETPIIDAKTKKRSSTGRRTENCYAQRLYD